MASTPASGSLQVAGADAPPPPVHAPQLLALASLGAAAAAAPGRRRAQPLRPRYLLMDAKGRAVTSETFPEQFSSCSVSALAFCPDVYPTTLAEVADILKQLGPLAERVPAGVHHRRPARDTRSCSSTPIS
ncbi:MAG: SCO family protein [Rhodocyclaceae bacterium]